MRRAGSVPAGAGNGSRTASLRRCATCTPTALGDRRRLVGLLHAALDLVEDAVAQRRERREHRVGVRVLGLEVGDDVGVVAVAEPEPVVDAVVAVRGQRVGHAASVRRATGVGSGHRRASINGPAARPRPLRFRPHAARRDADPVHAGRARRGRLRRRRPRPRDRAGRGHRRRC